MRDSPLSGAPSVQSRGGNILDQPPRHACRLRTFNSANRYVDAPPVQQSDSGDGRAFRHGDDRAVTSPLALLVATLNLTNSTRIVGLAIVRRYLSSLRPSKQRASARLVVNRRWKRTSGRLLTFFQLYLRHCDMAAFLSAFDSLASVFIVVGFALAVSTELNRGFGVVHQLMSIHAFTLGG